MSFRDYLTIGEVVQKLQTKYQDLTVSKLRFLEDEGLITPERTEGGYRKYSRDDLARIELILRLQRERFLPLAVIKVKLDEYDRGLSSSEIQGALAAGSGGGTSGGGSTGNAALSDADAKGGAGSAGGQSDAALLLGRDVYAIEVEPKEMLAISDIVRDERIPEQFILELKKYGIIPIVSVAGGGRVSRSDLSCIRAAWELRAFGIEPRHVRMYATFADKEALTFEQFLRPTYRHKTPRSKEKLAEVLRDITQQTELLKRRLLQRSLKEKLGDLL